MGKLHFSKIVIFLAATTLTASCSKQYTSALPPSGLRYTPDVVVLQKNQQVSLVPTLDEVNRQKPLFIAIEGGRLPTGISLNPDTGAIYGTPTEDSAPKTYTIAATTLGGITATQITIAVSPPPPPPAPICSYPATTNVLSGNPLAISPIISPSSGIITSYALTNADGFTGTFNSTTGAFSQSSFAPPIPYRAISPTVTVTGPGGSNVSCGTFTITSTSYSYLAAAAFTGPTAYQISKMTDPIYSSAFKATFAGPANFPTGFTNKDVTPAPTPTNFIVDLATGAASSSTNNLLPDHTYTYDLKFSKLAPPLSLTIPATIRVFDPPKLGRPDGTFSYYVKQNNLSSTKILNTASTTNLEYSILSADQRVPGVDIDTTGNIIVDLTRPLTNKVFDVCATFSTAHRNSIKINNDVKDCAKLNIEVKDFTIKYAASYTVKWNQPILAAAAITPVVTNGPGSVYATSTLPATLGVINSTSGLITSSNVTAAPGTYNVSVSANSPDGTGGTHATATSSFVIVVEVDVKPSMTYTPNPWIIQNTGAVTPLVPAPGPVAPTSYDLSGCNLASIGLSFTSGPGSDAGKFSLSSPTNTSPRGLGTLTCVVTPKQLAGTTTITGTPVTLEIQSVGKPNIVVVGVVDTTETNHPLSQNVGMKPEEQDTNQVELDMGKVTVGGQYKEVTFKVKNDGSTLATNVQLNLVSGSPSYSWRPVTPSGLTTIPLQISSLAAGASTEVSVYFSPESFGINRGIINISYTDINLSPMPKRSIALKGTGLNLVVSSPTRNFGFVPKGTTFEAWEEVRNLGDSPVHFEAIKETGFGATVEFKEIKVNNSIVMQTGGGHSGHCISEVPSPGTNPKNYIPPRSVCYFAIYLTGPDDAVVINHTLKIKASDVANDSNELSMKITFKGEATTACKSISEPPSTVCTQARRLKTISDINLDPATWRSNGVGTVANPILICEKEDLDLLADLFPTDETKTYVGWKDLNFRQCKPILMGGIDFKPISEPLSAFPKNIPFLGSYDGGYNLIDEVKINQPTGNQVGMFGILGKGAKITRVKVKEGAVTGRVVNIAGSVFPAGVLVGAMGEGFSSVNNSTVRAEISYNLVHAGVTAGSQVGGLAGLVNAKSYLHHNEYVGTVNGSSEVQDFSINDNIVSRPTSVGGLVGRVSAGNNEDSVEISNSVSYSVVMAQNNSGVGGAVGTISHATIALSSSATLVDHIYSSSLVFGGDPIRFDGGGTGGLVGLAGRPYLGKQNSVTIKNSVAAGSVSGPLLVGGLIGSSGSGVTVTDSKALGDVIGNYKNYRLLAGKGSPSSFGGFVGLNASMISNAIAVGDVKYRDASDSEMVGLNHQMIGGFAGVNAYGAIDHSVSYGTVLGINKVGGFVGRISSNDMTDWPVGIPLPGLASPNLITFSASYGSVNKISTGNATSMVGGFAGSNGDDLKDVITFSNVTGVSQVGGLVGQNSGTTTNAVAANAYVSKTDTDGKVFSQGSPTFGSNSNSSSCSYWASGIIATQTELTPYKDLTTNAITALNASQVSALNWLGWNTTNSAKNLGFPVPNGLPPLNDLSQPAP